MEAVNGIFEPNLYNINSDYAAGNTDIEDGGNNMYDRGIYISVPALTNNYVVYTDNCAQRAVNGQQYSMDVNNNGFSVTVFSPYNQNNIAISGGLGADGSGNVHAGSYQSGNRKGFWKTVKGPGDPGINHLFVTDAASPNHTWSTNTDADDDTLDNVNGNTVIYLMWGTQTNSTVSSDSVMQQLVSSIADRKSKEVLI